MTCLHMGVLDIRGILWFVEDLFRSTDNMVIYISVATGSSPKKSTKNREKKYRLYPKKVQKKYAFRN